MAMGLENIQAVAEFVRARLDEQEAVAKKALWMEQYRPWWAGTEDRKACERTLADIKAKRAIVDVCLRLDDLPIGGGLWFQVSDHAEEILGHLASLWSEHPDYNPKWMEW